MREGKGHVREGKGAGMCEMERVHVLEGKGTCARGKGDMCERERGHVREGKGTCARGKGDMC